MAIAVAGFTHETNTFAPQPTTLADFGARKGGGIPAGAQVWERVEADCSFQGFCQAARESGEQLVPVLHAYAPPGGTIARACFEELAGRIVDGIRRAGRLDAVFLELHGAMVVDGIHAADLELVRRIRSVVGVDVPIVAALDSHGNVPRELVREADALVAYRTYPHVDMRATGARAFALLQPMLRNHFRWAPAFADLPFLMPLCRQASVQEPIRSAMAMLHRLEESAPGRFMLSLMTGFPLSDVPHCRPAVFGYGQDAQELSRAVAQLHGLLMEAEPQFKAEVPGVREAVERALAAGEHPVVLADVQDNAGGGASSDTVWAIAELLRQQAPDALVGMVYDPQVAKAAHEAGVGATLQIGLGGKLMPGHTPLEAPFVVEALRSEPVQLKGPMLTGAWMNLGPMALLRVGQVRIVVNSRRAQCLDREYFRVFGIEPQQHAVIVVKSTNHYRADFEQFAAQIIEFAAPGACAMDLSQLAFRNLDPQTRLPCSLPLIERST